MPFRLRTVPGHVTLPAATPTAKAAVLLVGLCALLLAAAPAPLCGQLPALAPGHALDGGVSHYHPRLKGRSTANGERYHPDSLTAAHRTLPFGTRVLVINAANRRTVEVRINDRGPFRPVGRVLDLSDRAARQLGFRGVARVSMVVLVPEGKAAPAPDSVLVRPDSLVLQPDTLTQRR